MSARVVPVSPNFANLLTLPRMLAIDGATCVLMGAFLVWAAGPLATALALSVDLLSSAGLALFPCAVVMFAGARCAGWTATIARVTIALNLGWIVGSVLVVALSSPNALGIAFVLVQAAAVLVITLLEIGSLRRWPAPMRAVGTRRTPA